MRSGKEVVVQAEKIPSIEKGKPVAGDAISKDEVVIEESNSKGKEVQ